MSLEKGIVMEKIESCPLLINRLVEQRSRNIPCIRKWATRLIDKCPFQI